MMRTVSPPTRSRETIAVLLTVVAVVFFSISAGVTLIVLDAGVSTAVLAGLRTVSSALLLAPVLLLFRRSQRKIPRRDFPVLLVYGCAAWSQSLLLYLAISRIPVGLALLLITLAPVWLTLWARFIRKQKMNRMLWPSIGILFAGLAMIAVPGASDFDPVGVFWAFLCSFALAAFFLSGQRLVSSSDPIVVTFWGFATGAVLWTFLGVTGLSGAWWSVSASATTALPVALGGALVPLGLLLMFIVSLGTVFPYVAIVNAVRYVPATYISLLLLTEPVGAALVAVWFFDQTLQSNQILGGFIVISGVAIALLSRPKQPAEDRELL
jgi:drug/metabolite transporter (DMT)-like permease